jgi:hypothetical protein
LALTPLQNDVVDIGRPKRSNFGPERNDMANARAKRRRSFQLNRIYNLKFYASVLMNEIAYGGVLLHEAITARRKGRRLDPTMPFFPPAPEPIQLLLPFINPQKA